MTMFIHFFCLCPLGLAIKLNFNISKVVYSPPHISGNQMPRPLEDLNVQISRKRRQMPGICVGDGGGMLKLRFAWYISCKKTWRMLRTQILHKCTYSCA